MDNSELLILLDSEPQLKAKARCLAELGFAWLRELPCWPGGRSNAGARVSQATELQKTALQRSSSGTLKKMSPNYGVWFRLRSNMAALCVLNTRLGFVELPCLPGRAYDIHCQGLERHLSACFAWACAASRSDLRGDRRWMA